MSLGSALQQIADELTAVGVPGAVDSRDLVLPGALVAPGLLDFDRLDAATFSVDIEIYLVAPDVGAQPALDLLIELVTKVRTIYPVPTADPVTVNLANHAPGGLPALHITLPFEITE